MGNDTEFKPQVAEDDNDDTPVPLYKKALCGNHWFGDFFYMFWRGVRCPDKFCACCRFFQGFVFSLVVSGFILWNC